MNRTVVLKNVTCMALCASVFSSCAQEEALESNPLMITAGIETRASGTSWDSGDQIGVFLTDGLSKSNVLFTNTASGISAIFEPTNPVYYPSTGTVDLLAYYPYNDSTTANAYTVDVNDQSSPEQIDLMVAKSNDAVSGASSVEMIFEHKLSLIQIAISNADGITSDALRNLNVSISGLAHNSTYNLTEDKFANASVSETPLDLKINQTGTSATAIILPQEANTAVIKIELASGKTYTAELTSPDFVTGKKYSYTATLRGNSIKIESSSITDWVPGNEETELF